MGLCTEWFLRGWFSEQKDVIFVTQPHQRKTSLLSINPPSLMSNKDPNNGRGGRLICKELAA